MAGVEEEGDVGAGELRRVLDHGFAPVRGDDSQVYFGGGGVGYPIAVGVLHGAGVEGGDLVVVRIGGYERLSGEGARHFDHVSEVDAVFLQPSAIRREILPHGAHGQRVAAEQFQVVGDIAGAAAEFPPQIRHGEAYIEDVRLFGKDVVLEPVVEHHDGVVGEGTGDQGGHGRVAVTLRNASD